MDKLDQPLDDVIMADAGGGSRGVRRGGRPPKGGGTGTGGKVSSAQIGFVFFLVWRG